MKSILQKKVPDLWLSHSYPSLKPLGSFVKDLAERLNYFIRWVENGQPRAQWISGFFFTQSFITAVLQNFSRKYTIAIDKLAFNFQIMGHPRMKNDMEKNFYESDDGSLIYGLFIEGARWDYDENYLEESQAKVLWSEAPIIKLIPVEQDKVVVEASYNCPIYRTAERKGILMTTGHSSNFIMRIRLPSRTPERHWIKRGVAMVTQLSD
jgi:dynein heavy chain